jgi:hypothetical protein
VHELVTGIPLSATNSGADEACEQVLKNERPDTPPRGSCFDVDGTPEFVLGTDDEPGDMRIVFSGTQTTSASNRLQTVDRTVVYAYRKGPLRARRGAQPRAGFLTDGVFRVAMFRRVRMAAEPRPCAYSSLVHSTCTPSCAGFRRSAGARGGSAWRCGSPNGPRCSPPP